MRKRKPNKLLIKIKSFIDFLFISVCLNLLKETKKNRNKNLLFFNTGQIGDLIVSTKLFDDDYIFNIYKNVYFIIREEYSELFDNYKGKIKIVGLNYNKYKFNYYYRFYFLRMLQGLDIDSVYNLTSARGNWNDSLALCSGAKNKYCYANSWVTIIKIKEAYIEKLYSKILCREIFNEYNRIDYIFNRIQSQNNINVQRKHDVKSAIPNEKEYDILIAPFSSDGDRDLDVNSINKIISYQKSKKIFILCSKNQIVNLNGIIRNSNVTIPIKDYKLSELSMLIGRSKVFIGLDSGLTHIALKINCSCIILVGGGNYGRYLPKPMDHKSVYLADHLDCFNCEWECSKAKMYCLTNIKIEQINFEISRILNEDS